MQGNLWYMSTCLLLVRWNLSWKANRHGLKTRSGDITAVAVQSWRSTLWSSGQVDTYALPLTDVRSIHPAMLTVMSVEFGDTCSVAKIIPIYDLMDFEIGTLESYLKEILVSLWMAIWLRKGPTNFRGTRDMWNIKIPGTHELREKGCIVKIENTIML